MKLVWLITRSFYISVLAGAAAFALFLVTHRDKNRFHKGAIIKTIFACLLMSFCTLASLFGVIFAIGIITVMYITSALLELIVVNSYWLEIIVMATIPVMIAAVAVLAKFLFSLEFHRAICFSLVYPGVCSLLLGFAPNKTIVHSAQWFLPSTPLAICEEPLP
jgi:hypothetical protein